MGEGSGRGSGQTFCRQSRVGSGQRFAGSGRIQEKWPVDNSGSTLRDSTRSCLTLLNPTRSCFTLLNPTRSCLTLLNPTRSCFTLLDPAWSCLTLAQSYLILFDPVQSYQILFDLAQSYLILFDPAQSYLIRFDSTRFYILDSYPILMNPAPLGTLFDPPPYPALYIVLMPRQVRTISLSSAVERYLSNSCMLKLTLGLIDFLNNNPTLAWSLEGPD